MNERMRSRAAAALLLTAALAGATTACDDPTGPDVWAERRAELSSNRELWTSHGIDSYAYVYSTYCVECGSRRAVVRVRGGEIVAAERFLDGEPIPPAEWASLRTIDELFDLLESAIDERVDAYEVDYHAAGYPTRISIAHDLEAADAGMTIEVAGLAASPH